MKTWNMDPCFLGLTDLSNDTTSDDGSILLDSSFHYPALLAGNELEFSSDDLNFLRPSLQIPSDTSPGIFFPSRNSSPDGASCSESTGFSPEGQPMSSSEEADFFEPVLKYISQMLMEENIEENHTLHDPLALQETEKSLYEVLGQKNPFPTSQTRRYPCRYIQSPNTILSTSRSEFSGNGGSITSSSNSIESQFLASNYISQFSSINSSLSSFSCPNSLRDDEKFSSSLVDSLTVHKLFSDPESVLLFEKGLQDASKFIPDSSKLIIDVEKTSLPVIDKEVEALKFKCESTNSANGVSGRKNHQRDLTMYEEERGNKKLAPYGDESGLSEMFDEVFICNDKTEYTANDETASALKSNKKASGSKGGKSNTKKKGSKKKETVDLRSLLGLCAQAISSDDRRTATELLKQLRQHSSPTGDGSQRLAHFFTNGLEARLNGNASETQDFYTKERSLMSRGKDALKTFQLYFSSCPFRKFMIYFASKMILRAAKNARTLHIIDFGILYGFHWPILIHLLANRPGGPPKLKITGVELPQRGFRPKERIDRTGRELENYCKRFGVPFEYNGIASHKWETIQIDDLKINSDEFIAVNCPVRFQSLPDETVEANSPRDAVLKLVRKMNPNIVVHCVLNATHNTPFFLARFRESLFHFSALFDMFDTIVPCESEERLNFEREFYGREIMNIIACEGSERIDRPETYKQWQVRDIRAGFKQLPLDNDLLKEFNQKLKAHYNKDFVIDKDSNWMLLGWRGRILYAASCWVPA